VTPNRRYRSLNFRATLAALLFAFSLPAQEWSQWGGSWTGTKYSPLDQINKENAGKLKIAWEFDTGDFSDGTKYPSRSAFEATPLVAGGVMYFSTPFHRLIALNPENGEKLWEFDTKFDRAKRVNLYTSRGVSYWTDGKQKRILIGNQQGDLYSVDAETGKADPKFGDNGKLDLKRGILDKFPDRGYGLTSPPAICRDTVVVGGWVSDGDPQGPAGDIRGFDVRSGKHKWTFHTVPRPGEYGHDTWEGDGWKDRGGTNSWSISSVDEEAGLVYVPLTSPSADYYGGDRKGANLFGDSLLALNCESGERKWHFQTIHHDLWDWDLPSQPVLMTLKRDGRDVPAVAQATKTGFVFVFNRLTGEPLFDIEERPVPQSPLPTEQTSPTQPFPVKPKPFARQSMTKEEITKVTPESRAECLEMTKDAVIDGPLFRPITEELTVMFPGTNGGSNWGGGSFDPETHTFYVNSMDVAAFFRMVKRPEGSGIPYRTRSTKYGRFWDGNQYPCQQPPWGTLTAIDLNTGEHRWQSVLGEFDELTARGVPKTGAPNLGGSIVTKGGLVFIAATNDDRFRAFDKATGKEVWVTRLPASGHATPMTYLGAKSGKQFVVIAAGGGNKYNSKYMARLIAYALP
jgi:quinoprotein glucose dehydrogenase